jgi:acyl-coenzyme A synthetase/AMP-(fatty) acid ligase
VRVDLATRKAVPGEDGFLVRAPRGEAGLLTARADADDAAGAIVEGAFEKGDRWSVLHDVVREDADGDYWFVDSLAGFVTTKGGKAVSTRKVEDALYSLPEVEMASALGERGALKATFVAREKVEEGRIAEALEKLEEWERPSEVRQVAEIELTDGFRPRK